MVNKTFDLMFRQDPFMIFHKKTNIIGSSRVDKNNTKNQIDSLLNSGNQSLNITSFKIEARNFVADI